MANGKKIKEPTPATEKTPKLISKAEFAKQKGVSKQAVTKMVQNGAITVINGKIPVTELNQKTNDYIEDNQQARETHVNKSVSEARIKAAQAELEELKLAKARGEVVSREDVIETNAYVVKEAISKFRGIKKKVINKFKKNPETKWDKILEQEIEQSIESINRLKFNNND